jgi:hypothetical protein
VAADSTIAPLFAVGIARLAGAGTERYVELVGILAVIVDAIVILVWLLRPAASPRSCRPRYHRLPRRLADIDFTGTRPLRHRLDQLDESGTAFALARAGHQPRGNLAKRPPRAHRRGPPIRLGRRRRPGARAAQSSRNRRRDDV